MRTLIKIKILSSASLPVSHALSLPQCLLFILPARDTVFTAHHKGMELKQRRKKPDFTENTHRTELLNARYGTQQRDFPGVIPVGRFF
jgi:hypothetical protein